ncbi:neuronal membrane glycoprotein M6-a-like [Diadema antillarum]|uniref:neuronal membrane glycoprotein M6-a-like n=1 Tax=Diadema antillarum TaxID=105358 RepID=UPI003A8BD594
MAVNCCDYALCRCLRRVPYATIFALLVLAGGLALMTYEILSIDDTVEQMFRGTHLDPTETKQSSKFYQGTAVLFWVLFGLVALIGCFGLLLLIMACMTAGPSKKNACGRRAMKCVGRISTSVMIMLCYFLCVCWMLGCIILAMPLTFMLMVQSYCAAQGGVYPNSTCLDLNQYGFAAPAITRKVNATMVTTTTPTPTPTTQGVPLPLSAADHRICGNDLRTFCEHNEDISLSVYLTVTAAVIVVLALIHFLMALAANHTYIRIFHKDLPSKTKYGGNDYIGHRYSDAGIPLQEPLNVQDENTHF